MCADDTSGNPLALSSFRLFLRVSHFSSGFRLVMSRACSDSGPSNVSDFFFLILRTNSSLGDWGFKFLNLDLGNKSEGAAGKRKTVCERWKRKLMRFLSFATVPRTL